MSDTRYVISRFNHDTAWIKDYTDNYVIYDRSEVPVDGAIVVPNIGTDWYDKLGWIIENYDNLPDVALLTKCNIFKYITPEEFELIKDNKTFTPILTQNHKVYEPICRYVDGMYEERNNMWYLRAHPTKIEPLILAKFLGIADKEYIQFAPGSSYIVPKETILKHPKEDYEYLRSLLWGVYCGEAQIIERGIYNWWKLK